MYNGRNLIITRHPLKYQYTQPSKKPFIRIPGGIGEDFDWNIYYNEKGEGEELPGISKPFMNKYFWRKLPSYRQTEFATRTKTFSSLLGGNSSIIQKVSGSWMTTVEQLSWSERPVQDDTNMSIIIMIKKQE